MNVSTLKQKLQSRFFELQASPNLQMVLQDGFADRRLYAIYMTETYHYTRHNSRNQALVATRNDEMDLRYMKFCLRHAEEEVGHEKMALHDLRHCGYDVSEVDLPPPLPATVTLIAYLYYLAEKGNPVARLGYSFWAEQCYESLKPMLQFFQGGLALPNNAMTFFREHSVIDETHARQVTKAIEEFVVTEADWLAVEECMMNSLLLTTKLMDQVLEEFIKVKNNQSTRYHFLNEAR